MPRRQKESYSIQSVEHALDLLEALSEAEEEVRIAQLSEQLGMNKTSIFRLLATFANRGYVEKEEKSGKYRLGFSAFETGQKLLSRMGLLRTAKPVIEKLARACDEALYLAVPHATEILLLDMVDTMQQVKIIPLLGQRFPITGTSAGQVILAHSPSHLKACTGKIPESLTAELPKIAEQGYCIESGDFGEGIASLAVPLLNAEKKVLGSLCLIGPEFRLTREKIETQLLPQLQDAGIIVSSKLGYVGYFIDRRL